MPFQSGRKFDGANYVGHTIPDQFAHFPQKSNMLSWLMHCLHASCCGANEENQMLLSTLEGDSLYNPKFLFAASRVQRRVSKTYDWGILLHVTILRMSCNTAVLI